MNSFVRGEHLICVRCDETIEDGQLSECRNTPLHRECFFRMIVGSACHVLCECSCYGGTRDGDPEGLTTREAAMVATLAWYAREHPELEPERVIRMCRGDR